MNFGMITLSWNKARLCYTNTDSLVIYIETEDFYKDIADDIEKWFDSSNYDENDERPLPIGKNKIVIAMFKDELGGKIWQNFAHLEQKYMHISWKMAVNIKKLKERKSV